MTSTTDTASDRRDPAGRLALTGLLVIVVFVGYEWLMSGLTKIVRGGFPSGLADELREKSEGTVGWYKSFLDGSVIPNARAFGVVIEVGELLIGEALVAGALLWLLRWEQLGYRSRVVVLAAVALASLGAILMNVAFHLANGSAHPWLIPKEGFDEGVDLDSLLPLIQLVFLVVSARLLVMLRRDRAQAGRSARGTAATTPPSRPASASR